MPSGGRYWRFDYAFNDKRRTMALGVYPDVPLALARTRLQGARERLAAGVDPLAERRVDSLKFEAVAREWHRRWKAGRAPATLRRFSSGSRRMPFRTIGSRVVSKLAASDFRDVALRSRSAARWTSPSAFCRTAVRSCAMRSCTILLLTTLLPGEPSDILKPRRKRNYPRVTAVELPDIFLRAIDGYVGGEHTRLALQLMSLTFVRTSELIGLAGRSSICPGAGGPSRPSA